MTDAMTAGFEKQRERESEIENARPLKCYFGGSSNPYDHAYVSHCFARTQKEAKKLMWSQGRLNEECDGEWIDARIERKPAYDKLADGMQEAYIATDTKIEREMGWMMDGDTICGTCGLATMDNEYPVCDECDQCTDCGHSDGCESA